MDPQVARAGHARLPLVDAIRAVLATTIAWHHFFLYGPLADPLAASENGWLAWLLNYRWIVPAFFVISGFVMARSMLHGEWRLRQLGIFVVHRYCRLGLPYLAAIALAIVAATIARGDLSDDVVGPVPTGPQLLAHALLLQDILGYPALSAGLWFVCIDFQLSLLLAVLLVVRDTLNCRRPGTVQRNLGTAQRELDTAQHKLGTGERELGTWSFHALAWSAAVR